MTQSVTVIEEGFPQVRVAWGGVDSDDLVCGHLAALHEKLRNLRRGSCVAMSLELLP